MVRRVKFSLRGVCIQIEKAEKISLNFPHRKNCCFPHLTMKSNISISTWISYPLRSWYVFARAQRMSNQTVNLEVTVFQTHLFMLYGVSWESSKQIMGLFNFHFLHMHMVSEKYVFSILIYTHGIPNSHNNSIVYTHI